MSGRSRWWGWLSALVWLVVAASCSELPIPHLDGAVGDTAPPMTFGPRALTPLSVDAVALAADDSGIYWMSSAGGLWLLSPGTLAPHNLANDVSWSPASWSCPSPSGPLLTPGFVFWSSANRRPVRRTRKGDAGSDVLTSTAPAGPLAADATNVYWTEGVPGVDGSTAGVIKTLAQDASAGSAPTTLVSVDAGQAVSSLAVRDGALYWTPYVSAGSTPYDATLWKAPLDALAQGGRGGAVVAPRSPFGLTQVQGVLLFGVQPNISMTSLARLPPDTGPQVLATLPSDQVLAGLTSAGGWLLASTYADPPNCKAPALNLYATLIAGGPPKLIAQGIRTPAIAAPQGIVFVDASKQLVALPPDQIDAIVSPVP